MQTSQIVASLTTVRQNVSHIELKRFFTDIKARIGQEEAKATPNLSELKSFFSEIRDKVEPQQRLLDQKMATGFNVFDFIDPDENKLSDILAWLLDPKGSHGQNDLFLQLIFKQLNLGSSKTFTIDAKVVREAPNPRHREISPKDGCIGRSRCMRSH